MNNFTIVSNMKYSNMNPIVYSNSTDNTEVLNLKDRPRLYIGVTFVVKVI